MRTLLSFFLSFCVIVAYADLRSDVTAIMKDGVLKKAEWAKTQKPVTITDFSCERSLGSRNDFYSDSDYWWPNPDDPDGPYIRRDGQTNPANFVAHRHAMVRFSEIVGILASAYIITGDDDYVKAAMPHIKAWFIDPKTKMNPNLNFAQAVRGVSPGRSSGIIDSIHFIEVAQGIRRMAYSNGMNRNVYSGAIKWFAEYLDWLTRSAPGIEEMESLNNHGTCWVVQAAVYARLTANKNIMELCSDRYKYVLLPTQMADNGSFPRELARTKPYGYSIFNLDAMATVCQVLSCSENDLWNYHPSDRPSLKQAYEFLMPYLKDKSKWFMPADVMYFDEWPVAQPGILFGAINYNNNEWFEVWKKYDHFPTEGEVVRNVPARNPLLWI